MKQAIALFALTLALVLSLYAGPPLAEGWRDANARQRQQAALAYERQQFELAQYQERQRWSQPGQIVGSYVLGGLGLLTLALALAGAADFYRRRAVPLVPADAGLVPRRQVETLTAGEIQELTALRLQLSALVDLARAQHQPGQLPLHLSYAPRIDGRAAAPALIAAPGEAGQPPPDLPGMTDLSALLPTFRPTPAAILLGVGPGGAPITAPLKRLWHIGTAGPTGAGKSNIARLVLGQLLALGARAVLADPKWTPYDAENDEDWRPIASRLHLAPARKPDEIADLVNWSVDELDQRLERRTNGAHPGPPLFFYLDEFTTITEDVKDAAGDIARLARLGRGVNMFLLMAAHNFLVKSGAGDTRDQVRTCYYLGGDLRTGSVLLDMPQRALGQLESQLETGVALLRSAATQPARPVRVPLASNASLYQLLGGVPPASVPPPDAPAAGLPDARRTPDGCRMDVSGAASGRREPLNPQHARILDLFRSGTEVKDIVQQLHGPLHSGTREYREARSAVEAVIRRAMG